jgi:hypothetical protein
MGTKQRSVRLPKWLENAVNKFGERNHKDFTETVNWLLTYALHKYGYYEHDYDPDMTESPLDTMEASDTGVVPPELIEKAKKKVSGLK